MGFIWDTFKMKLVTKLVNSTECTTVILNVFFAVQIQKIL
jgi:hypothetical protein